MIRVVPFIDEKWTHDRSIVTDFFQFVSFQEMILFTINSQWYLKGENIIIILLQVGHQWFTLGRNFCLGIYIVACHGGGVSSKTCCHGADKTRSLNPLNELID